MPQNEHIEILVSEASAGARLDAFLAEATGLTRSAAQKAVEEGRVTDEKGNFPKKNLKVSAGERFYYMPPELKEVELTPLELELDIVYEDGDLAVINKPRGIVVHPSAGHENDTLVNALMAHMGDSLSGINGELRPGIVHRIDKDTSGLLVVAKNDMAHLSLAEQIKEHSARRTYEAVVRGGFSADSGTVDAPIARDPRERKRMAVVRGGRDAVTHWAVINRFGQWTHIRCILETGRTHQIRVHMAHIGHPVAGDPLYGGKDELNVGGQCLHARELEFTHPRTGERMHFSTELPDYFKKVLTKLENHVK